jgi:hypothetical protein
LAGFSTAVVDSEDEEEELDPFALCAAAAATPPPRPSLPRARAPPWLSPGLTRVRGEIIGSIIIRTD